MEHKTMFIAAAVLVVAIAAGSTGYALSDSGGTKTTGPMFSRSCAEATAPQMGYKVVSFNPLTLKAIKAHPWSLQIALTTIRDLCTVTVGSTPGGSATTQKAVPQPVSGTTPSCESATVHIRLQPNEPSTSTCLEVGAELIVTGGFAGVQGSWPNPPTLSDPAVLRLTSYKRSGMAFTAYITALSLGVATVDARFVNSESDCTPTPCTPIPGRDLLLWVTVVDSSSG
jgi:hypothetical protein